MKKLKTYWEYYRYHIVPELFKDDGQSVIEWIGKEIKEINL